MNKKSSNTQYSTLCYAAYTVQEACHHKRGRRTPPRRYAISNPCLWQPAQASVVSLLLPILLWSRQRWYNVVVLIIGCRGWGGCRSWGGSRGGSGWWWWLWPKWTQQTNCLNLGRLHNENGSRAWWLGNVWTCDAWWRIKMCISRPSPGSPGKVKVVRILTRIQVAPPRDEKTSLRVVTELWVLGMGFGTCLVRYGFLGNRGIVSDDILILCAGHHLSIHPQLRKSTCARREICGYTVGGAYKQRGARSSKRSTGISNQAASSQLRVSCTPAPMLFSFLSIFPSKHLSRTFYVGKG